MTRTRFLAMICAMLLPLGFPVHAAESLPRYILVNFTPGLETNQNDPSSYTAGKLKAVTQTIKAPVNPQLSIGVSATFSVLDCPPDREPTLVASMGNLLNASRESRVPVLVILDTMNWWTSRPDLWNWWDPQAPGYNPENANNVEWTDWGPQHAVKICWRNWGRQLRVAPMPNLFSPRVRAETEKRLRLLTPIIAKWVQDLPQNEKYLLAGVKMGWEDGIGYNAFYYPNGNKYLEQWPKDESHDPGQGLDVQKGWPCGAAAIGYAAATSAGLKQQGTLIPANISGLMRRIISRNCKMIYKLGIPKDLIFNHQGGTYAPYDKHIPYAVAFNDWSTPGWSFYYQRPETPGDLGAQLERAGRRRWAAAEWWWNGKTQAEWENHIESALKFKDCRFVCIYNWDPLGRDPTAIQALRAVVSRWRESR